MGAARQTADHDPGATLDPGVRSEMERSFGRSFGNVVVHTGPWAAGAANRLHASAFTVGEHVSFAPGEYDPESVRGRMLIAHELAHVVQQSGRSAESAPRTGVGARAEADADGAAFAVAAGGTAQVAASTPVGVACADRDWWDRVKDESADLWETARPAVKTIARAELSARLGANEGLALTGAGVVDDLIWLGYAQVDAVDWAVDKTRELGGLSEETTEAVRMVAHFAANDSAGLLKPLREVAKDAHMVDEVTGAPVISPLVTKPGDALMTYLNKGVFAEIGPEGGLFTKREMGQMGGSVVGQVLLSAIGVKEVQLALKVVGAAGTLRTVVTAYQKAVKDGKDPATSPEVWVAVGSAILSAIGLSGLTARKKLLNLFVDAASASWSLGGAVYVYADHLANYHEPDRDAVLHQDQLTIARTALDVMRQILTHAASGKHTANEKDGQPTGADSASPPADGTTPGANQPAAKKSGGTGSGGKKSGGNKSGSKKSGAKKASSKKATTGKKGGATSGATKPGAGQTGTGTPPALKSGAAKSGATKAGAEKSGGAKAGTGKPSTTTPSTTTPGAAKAGAATPGADKPGAASKAGTGPMQAGTADPAHIPPGSEHGPGTAGKPIGDGLDPLNVDAAFTEFDGPRPPKKDTVSSAQRKMDAARRQLGTAELLSTASGKATSTVEGALESAKQRLVAANDAAQQRAAEYADAPAGSRRAARAADTAARKELRAADAALRTAERKLAKARAAEQTATQRLDAARQREQDRAATLAAAQERAAMYKRGKGPAGRAARKTWEEWFRPFQVHDLGAMSHEQLHHAIELNVLNRYPGVFSPLELLRSKNIRVIPLEARVKDPKNRAAKAAKKSGEPAPDSGTKQGDMLGRVMDGGGPKGPGDVDGLRFHEVVQPDGKTELRPTFVKRDSSTSDGDHRPSKLHQEAIRKVLDDGYLALDRQLAQAQANGRLMPGTPEYKTFVRSHVENLRDVVDHLYGGQFGAAREAAGLRPAPPPLPIPFASMPRARGAVQGPDEEREPDEEPRR